MQDKLRRAAKAKIMRWVRPHQKRVKLDAPEMLKSEWQNGDRDKLADLYCEVNFDQDTMCICMFDLV